MTKINEKIDFPEVWDELTRKDWADCLNLRQKIINRKIAVSIMDVKCETVRCLLLNRGIKTRYSSEKYYLLIYKLAIGLDWLWKDNSDGLELVYRSTVNLIPKFGYLVGPRSHGEDLTFGEFKQAVSILKMYDEKKDDAYLKILCGLLYRHKSDYRKTGAWRESMEKETAMDWMKRGARMPEQLRWGTYAWFAFFAEYLMTGDFIIDGALVNFSCLFEKSAGTKKSECNDIGLNAIAFSIAESKVFGDVKEVHNTQLLRIMLKMLNDYNKAKELEKGEKI